MAKSKAKPKKMVEVTVTVGKAKPPDKMMQMLGKTMGKNAGPTRKR